jgi:hypothetical protein
MLEEHQDQTMMKVEREQQECCSEKEQPESHLLEHSSPHPELCYHETQHSRILLLLLLLLVVMMIVMMVVTMIQKLEKQQKHEKRMEHCP